MRSSHGDIRDEPLLVESPRDETNPEAGLPGGPEVSASVHWQERHEHSIIDSDSQMEHCQNSFKAPTSAAPAPPSSSPKNQSGQNSCQYISKLQEQSKGVLQLTIHHAQGTKRVDATSLHRLEVGSRLFIKGKHMERTRVSTMPAELQQDVFYLPADTNDASIGQNHEYAVGRTLGCFARMYILLPSLMRPPRWLAAGFQPLHAPGSAPCHVQCSWHVDIAMQIFLHLARKTHDYHAQVLSVWESTKVYAPGEKFTVQGADGNAEATDWPYVLAFRFAKSEQALTSQVVAVNIRMSKDVLMQQHELSKVVTGRDGKTMVEWLLRTNNASSADMSLLEDTASKANLDNMLNFALNKDNSEWIKTLLSAGALRQHLRDDNISSRIERMAVNRNDISLIMLLYSKSKRELTFRSLQFLIHSLSMQRLQHYAVNYSQHHGNEEIERFLLEYVRERRNPLSVTAAILRVVTDEMANYDESVRFMRLVYTRFHSLHLAMLKQLSKYSTEARMLSMLDRIMRPAEVPTTVNEISPLQVAFELYDTRFMSNPFMATYMLNKWRGHHYALLTSRDDPRSTSLLSPLVCYRILKNLGFCGGFADFFLVFIMRMWHLYTLTSTAFFNSPRGRWAMHALCETIFLALYQFMVMYPRSEHKGILNPIFLAFVVGNLLDIAQFLRYKFGAVSTLKRYLYNPWNALNFLTNVALLLVICLRLARDNGSTALPDYDFGDHIEMAWCTLAVFVWVRALSLVVPVYPRLGPLLNTVWNMANELVAFVFPMFIIMTGFTTLLAGVYHERVADYASFSTGLLTLFESMLGNFNFDDFTTDQDGNDFNPSQHLYGCIVLVFFLISSNILLLNLLIAILTNHYRPEETEDETQFKQAQIVDYYQIQEKHNLICSPFNLLHVALFWLPSHERRKVHTTTMKALGIVPPDGIVLPDDQDVLSSGQAELPHLVFLLTLYPALALITNVSFYLMTPYCAYRFAISTWKRHVEGAGRKNKVADSGTDAGMMFVAYATVSWDKLSNTMSKTFRTKNNTHPIRYLGRLLFMLAFGAVGFIAITLFVGVLSLTIWATLYQWTFRLLYSLYNLLIRPWIQIVKRAKSARSRRSNQDAADAVATLEAGLDSQLSPDAETAQQTAAANALQPGSAAPGTASPIIRAATAGKSSKWGGHHMTARQRWLDAKDRVLTAIHDEYLTTAEIDKALVQSKFAALVRKWGIIVQPQTPTADDIMDAQMEDVDRDALDGDIDEDEVNDDAPDNTPPADNKDEVLAAMSIMSIRTQQLGASLQKQISALQQQLQALQAQLQPQPQQLQPRSAAA